MTFNRANEILQEVADQHGMPVEFLTDPCRSRQRVRAKDKAAWMIRKETDLSYPEIGEVMHCHHTAIMDRVYRHQQRALGLSH